MNVFEDLVVELKEQNLLEETVVERSIPAVNGNGKHARKAVKASKPADAKSHGTDGPEWSLPTAMASLSNGQRHGIETHARNLADRFQALQFTEYVLAAAENGANSSGSVTLDDLQLKKALHTYEQALGNPEGDEFFDAEAALVARLGGWEAMLAERDRNLPVEALRRYAEKANPPLSPQTLFALLRFYRSVPFSRAISSKFDFVLTRLFSKFAEREQRDLLCSRGEIVKHLKERYADWYGRGSSDALDETDATLLVLSFDDFISEVNHAGDLNEMRSSNLFERICQLKDNIGEGFFVPEVAAAAVECNIKIANKVIELVWAEMQRSNGVLPARFLKINGETLSEAAARTIELGELHGEVDEAAPEPTAKPASQRMTLSTNGARTKTDRPKKAKAANASRSHLLGVNRWLLLATILVVLFSLSIFVWSEYYAGDSVSTDGVRVVDLDKPELKKFIKISKISNDMLHAVVLAGYEQLDADGQRAYLQQVLQAGGIKGYSRVSFINEQGKQVGFASRERIETAKK